jgi:hypothetical protein
MAIGALYLFCLIPVMLFLRGASLLNEGHPAPGSGGADRA